MWKRGGGGCERDGRKLCKIRGAKEQMEDEEVKVGRERQKRGNDVSLTSYSTNPDRRKRHYFLLEKKMKLFLEEKKIPFSVCAFPLKLIPNLSLVTKDLVFPSILKSINYETFLLSRQSIFVTRTQFVYQLSNLIKYE